MAEQYFFTEFLLKFFFAFVGFPARSDASFEKKFSKVFPFCLSSNCLKRFSLRHIFDIWAAFERKPKFFNTLHSFLGLLVFFWS